MKSSLKTLLGAAAAIALAGAAASSLAQPPQGGPPPGGGPGFGRGGPPPSPEMREQMMTERLALRPDQQPALKTFLAATAPPAGERREIRSLTTPERLDRQLAELKARADATKRFYAALSAEQKVTFDAMPMPGMGFEGRGGGRGGPGGGGGGRRQGGPNQGFGAPPSP